MPGGSVRFNGYRYVERLRVVFDPDFSRKTISVNKKCGLLPKMLHRP